MGKTKFDYGDEVQVVLTAPLKYRPGGFGAVCGFIDVKFEELADKYEAKLGTLLCTIEFGDGETIQIPEQYLLNMDEKEN